MNRRDQALSHTSNTLTRRSFISGAARTVTGAVLAGGPLGKALAAASTSRPALPDRSTQAPASPVAVLRCESYEPRVFREALQKSFDLIGGVQHLVRNKTVTVKLNLTGLSWDPLFGLPAQETYQTQPHTVAALCALLSEAGARRVVLVENRYWDKPFEQVLTEAGWDLPGIHSAGDHRVSFEDTRNRGRFAGYSRFKVPWGGYVYPAFELNQRFAETDCLISLAKLKEHITAGVTGAVKNCFGHAPTALYGDTSPDERGLSHRAAMFHGGRKTPPAGVPGEIEHGLPKKDTVRVPHIVADLFGARPTDLNIVDGIRTIRGGEGPWVREIGLMNPKVLVVGRNGVCTDSVCTAVMGFDPQARHGQAPFKDHNHLRLLAAAGVGTNDLSRIEVRGASIEAVRCPFQAKQG